MQVFEVRHLTRYRYAKPVRLGEHRMMLRPRDDADQRLIAHDLAITPTPDALESFRDSFGNWVAVARFAEPASELSVVSRIAVARAEAARPDPPSASGRRPPLEGADAAVTDWARAAMRSAGWDGGEPPGADALGRLCGVIHSELAYRRRLEAGVQSARRTLELGSGACRDFAMLMITAARGLGLQARFASGYVHCEPRQSVDRAPLAGHTHAWASILTPDEGWIDYDPTSGQACPGGLIRVALAEDPADASPISGVWYGARGDYLGMEVEVDVRPAANGGFAAGADEPSPSMDVA